MEHVCIKRIPIWCYKDGPCIYGLMWCRNVQVEKMEYLKFYRVWHLNTRSSLTTLIKYSGFSNMGVCALFQWYIKKFLGFSNDVRIRYLNNIFKWNAIFVKLITRHHIYVKCGRKGRNRFYYTLYTTQVNVYSCFVYFTNTLKILLVFLGQRNHSSLFLLLASFTSNTLNYVKSGFITFYLSNIAHVFIFMTENIYYI